MRATGWKMLLLVGAAAMVAAVFSGASRATAVAFVGTTTQVTDKIGTQTDPSISGDIVVFTDDSSGSDDVHYSNLNTPGSDVAVTSAVGPQRLHDVSGNVIV
jgi:beta propeller repeat protein